MKKVDILCCGEIMYACGGVASKIKNDQFSFFRCEVCKKEVSLKDSCTKFSNEVVNVKTDIIKENVTRKVTVIMELTEEDKFSRLRDGNYYADILLKSEA